jgi:hypothetical protein
MTDDGSIWKCPIVGCGNTPTLVVTVPVISYTTGPELLAADDSNAYWLTGQMNGALRSVPLGGGQPTVRAFAEDPRGITLDDKCIYWADVGLGEVTKVAKP